MHVPINELFREAPVATRFFLRARSLITHYDELARELPTEGRLLDLGCGHGLLAFCLSLGHPGREVIAIDHDAERMRVAQLAALRLPVEMRPRFEVGDLRKCLASVAPGSLDGIAMLDVLHYFDRATQEMLLGDAGRAVKSGGTLIMRDVDSDAGTKFRANRFYERIATGIRFTKSTAQTLQFRGRREWTALVEVSGFAVRSKLSGPPIFADILFIGTKRQ